MKPFIFLKLLLFAVGLMVLTGQTSADWTVDVNQPYAVLSMTKSGANLTFTLTANDPTPPSPPSGLHDWKIEKSTDPTFLSATSTIPNGSDTFISCPSTGPDQTITYTPSGTSNLYFRATVRDCTGNITLSNTVTLSNAWLQTQTGDVHANTYIQTSEGPTSPIGCYNPTNPLATGLISTSKTLIGMSNKIPGSDGGVCIKETDKAAFVSYKLPGYEDLKSLYYTQAKSSITVIKETPTSSGVINLGGGKDHIYNFTGDLTITSPSDITGSQTGVIFIDGKLNIGPISSNKLGDNNSGLVFVVGGDVNIDKDVEEIDAIIISQGTIYTANNSSSDPTCATSHITAVQLIIKGSLVNLNPEKPIKFCRTLANNSIDPAEKIIAQPKYLIILKDLFADTYQKWSEIP